MKENPNTRRSNHLPLTACITLLMAAPVHASVLEEVIVTAQKREQNLQDVGVSVTAFTGEQMDALGWDDSLNIGAHTPGLVATSNTGDTGNVALFSIRGISQLDFAEGQEAPVALYMDDVYLSSPGASGFPIFDIARVEVLRGPQGTLYGRNATGGLVHFVSNRPTEEFEASVDLTVADFDQIRVTGAVSGPLGDNLQGRIAIYSNNHDGYVTNEIGEDKREGNTQAVRGQLNVDFDESSSLLINTRYVDIDEAGGVWHTVATKTDANGLGVLCRRGDLDCGNGPNPGPGETFSLFDVANGQIDDGIGDELDGAFNLDSGVDRETWGITLSYSKAFDSFNLTSITDYSYSDKNYLEDDDALSLNLVTYNAGAEIDQFSQELRIDGETDNMTWIAGAYYLDIQNDFFGAFQFPAQFAYFPRFDASADTRSWAVFGQIEYALSDTVSVTAGIRYNQDDKDLEHQMTECDVTVFNLGAGFCPASLISDPVIAADTAADPALDLSGFLVDGERRDFSRSDSEVSGKLQVDWRPTDNTLYYASFSRGTKGGGFNTPTDGFAAPPDVPFEPEILHAYELGAKTTLWDGKARLNASVFYYDYQDFQAFFFLNTTSLLINSDAEFTGAEVELYLAPGNGWEFSLGVAALDTEVNGPDGGGIVDQEAPLAPNFTANLLARKEWQMQSGSVAAQISANYQDENFFNIVNADTTTGGDYWLSDAKLTYASGNEKWEASLFVNNVFDERPVNYSYDISGFGNYTIFVVGPPRWVGANLKYNW